MKTVSFEIEEDEVIIPHIIKEADLALIVMAFCKTFGYKEFITEVRTEKRKYPVTETKAGKDGMMITTIVEKEQDVEVSYTIANPQTPMEFAKEWHAKIGTNLVQTFLDEEARAAKVREEKIIIVK